MADAICLGELLIDFVPTLTGTDLISAPAFKKAPGGAPANVAVGLSRLGVSSAFMGKVGDDAFGHFLAQTLTEAGVSTEPVRFSNEARTALAFVSLRADGEREFMFYRHPSADMLFTPEEVDVAAIRSAKLLHYGSISLIGEPSRSATVHAIKTAREAGCLVSYDANLRLPLWPDEVSARAGLWQGLRQAQIAKLSEEEVEFLTGSDDVASARQTLWHDDLQLLIITQGAQGSLFFTPTFAGEAASFSVTSVDTTGAGDGFVAGLLQGLIADPTTINDHARLQALCRFANAVGALATTERGAIPALPTRSQVQWFIDSQT